MALRALWGSLAGCALIVAQSARADIDPNSGIDFVRIGAVGNAPWMGTTPPTPGDRAVGRGSVGYEYRIGRFEVTTTQWVEFFNAAYDRPANDRIPFLAVPQTWAARGTTPTTPGGLRWSVPAGLEMYPVGDISWRIAAIYCNWLHNGKSTDRSAFLSGAYDVSTFGFFGNIFTDQAAHSPGARYWIPTWDEWLKAAHYDPSKPNADGTQGGWWRYSITSDTLPISNPPPSLAPGSNGQINAAEWTYANSPVGPFNIPLGAYQGVTSPWGLYDTGGATAEWTESIRTGVGIPPARIFDGSWWLDGPASGDAIAASGSDFPHVNTFEHGFRIASAVPAPGSGLLLVCAGAFAMRRDRKRFQDVVAHTHACGACGSAIRHVEGKRPGRSDLR